MSFSGLCLPASARTAFGPSAALLAFAVLVTTDAAQAGGRSARYADATRTGPYFGGFVAYTGYGSEIEETNSATSTTTDPHDHTWRPSLGVIAGYQWQVRDRFMVGIEGDWFYSEQDNNIASAINQPAGTSDRYQLAHWGTARARVGYAVAPGVLLSATAGLAIVDLDFADIDATSTFRGSKHGYGWAVGGGLDYDLTDHLRLRIDGLYASIGSWELPNVIALRNVKSDVTIVRSSLLWAY